MKFSLSSQHIPLSDSMHEQIEITAKKLFDRFPAIEARFRVEHDRGVFIVLLNYTTDKGWHEKAESTASTYKEALSESVNKVERKLQKRKGKTKKA